MRGVLITFEGSEGCGKTTQIEILANRFEEMGRLVLLTREPGGTPLGEHIRQLVKYSRAGDGMTPEAELLLFCASRAQLTREVIEPALRDGTVILCDRFHDSTTVYQGVARGLSPALIDAAHQLALGKLRPHLTLLLDMEAEEAHARALRRVRPVGQQDRMESEPPEFYARVRQGYLDLAANEPDRIRLIDASAPRPQIAEQIWKEVACVLDRP